MKTLQGNLSGKTCATMVRIDYEDDTVKNIYFLGGCHGLSSMLQRYVKKYEPSIVDFWFLIKDTVCGRKGTSCTNEIAKLIEEKLLDKIEIEIKQ